jgi:selenocysteine lyase/cysteine desulfurase
MGDIDRDIDELLQHEFPVEQNLLYLNHAAIAPLPRRSRDAVVAFADDCLQFGSRHYGRWQEQEHLLRERLRDLVNASHSDEIALVKSTSEGLSMVAHGFPWKDGDQVVITNQEFPSNRIAWESLSGLGVGVVTVPVDDPDLAPEDALIAALQPPVRLLAISSVQYGSGLRMDLERLGLACKARGIAFCVDGIQGLGAIGHDVQRMNIDFLVADAHKWMLGPEGIGLFYCARPWLEKLKLYEFGWHMVEKMGDFNNPEWAPASSARRFECGSANTLGVYAFSASLSLLLEVGMDQVERRVLERTRLLRDQIAAAGNLELISPDRPGQVAGITTLAHQTLAPERLHEALEAAGITCAVRGGGLRLAPHCYNDQNGLERVFIIINSMK